MRKAQYKVGFGSVTAAEGYAIEMDALSEYHPDSELAGSLELGHLPCSGEGERPSAPPCDATPNLPPLWPNSVRIENNLEATPVFLTINLDPLFPAISTQPQDPMIAAGASVTFSVAASGGGRASGTACGRFRPESRQPSSPASRASRSAPRPQTPGSTPDSAPAMVPAP